MSGVPLARVSQFAQVAAAIDVIGISPNRLTKRLNIPAWHHCSPEAFFPLEHMYKLMDLGARSAGDPTLGASVMERMPFQKMGTIGPLIADSATVYQALQAAITLLPRLGTSKRWWLAEDRNEVWFCRGGDWSFDVGEPQMIQYALTGMVQIVRLAAGPAWKPRKVRIDLPVALGLGATEMFGEAEILTGQSVSAIAIPKPCLYLPIRSSRPSTCSADANNNAQAGWDTKPPQDFIGSIGEIVLTLLSEGYPDVGRVAVILGLSTRTLQRRLAVLGSSYTQLVAAARFSAARQSLQQSDRSVSDIAFDLGYTDVAHFSRAFRRWAGVSPRTFRQLQTERGGNVIA